MRRVAASVMLVAAALPTPALAQAYQCRVPKAVTPPPAPQNGPTRSLPVTGYTLALSWSPDFCRGREGRRADVLQCSGRNGRFGLIVHGLWPESGRSWPQWCSHQGGPTGQMLAKNLCLTPSTRLLAHQWAKHGSCMTRQPETYFTVTRILWNGLRIPDYDRLSRQDGLTAGDIRRALADANPGWTPQAIGVDLDRSGWLEELKLCYDRRFMPVRCDKTRLGAGDDAPAKIWRGL